MGGSARRQHDVPATPPQTADRQAAAAAARAWLISGEVSRWLANVAADLPDHALNEHLHVTVEWR